MSLLIQPKIAFLDEPTTGVDPVSRNQLFTLIKHNVAYSSEEIPTTSSVLLTTHRMEEAERLCDFIAIMVNGRIVSYGTPSYLMETYGGGYEITLGLDSTKN